MEGKDGIQRKKNDGKGRENEKKGKRSDKSIVITREMMNEEEEGRGR